MAEKTDSHFSVVKEKKDAASNVDVIISPRKSARKHRSKKRKEEVQEAILGLSNNVKIKDKTDTLLNIDGGDSEVIDHKISSKTGNTHNKLDTSISKSSVKKETPKNKRKGRQSKKSLADGERSFLDSFTDTSVIGDDDIQDTSITETAVNGKDDVIKDSKVSKPKRKGRAKKSEALINSSIGESNDSLIQEDDSLIVNSESSFNESVTEPSNNNQIKPKRKGKPKKSAASLMNSSINESGTSFVQGDSSSKVQSETTVHEVNDKSPDNEKEIHKRKGRTKKSIGSHMNNSVDAVDKSVDVDDNRLNSRVESNISDSLKETPGNESFKSKRKGRAKKTTVPPLNNATDEANSSVAVEDEKLTVVAENITNENIIDSPDSLNIVQEKPKRAGRPKGSATKKKQPEVTEVIQNDTPKSRRKQRVNYASLNAGDNDEVLESTPKPRIKTVDETPVRESVSKSGRKRKRVDYAAFSKDEEEEEEEEEKDDDDDDFKTPVRKRRKIRAELVEEDDDEGTGEEKTPRKKTPGRPTESKSTGKAKSKPKVDLKCSRCEEPCSGKPELKRHMAIKHQALWTPENPEGLDDFRSLNQVIKIKKFLNCPKCGKQLNFLHYYKQHLGWCGRDSETFTCPVCNHEGLLAKWRDMHIRWCERNKLQKEEASKRTEERKSPEGDREEGQEGGKKKKRKAASKATTMLKNLSKDKDLTTEDHDNSDADADFELKASDNEEEVAEEFEEDEEEEEQSFEEEDSGLSDSGLIEATDGGGGGGWGRREKGYAPRGKNKDDFFFFKYHMTYDLMKKVVKKQMSTPLYTDLMPQCKDWVPVPESECSKYLPSACHSIAFTFSKKADKLESLDLYEATTVKDLPMFFTGLSVWKMAWCPTSGDKQAAQYLAIVGKVDRATEFKINCRVASPGLIQIWDTGIMSIKITTDSSPKLMMNIIHDYGTATDIKWCPSGCWQKITEVLLKMTVFQPDESSDDKDEVLPRMGLLACSFSDSTVRVFSVANLPCSSDENVPTYKPPPVLTLLPHKLWETSNISCSCVDWQSLYGHKQIIAGYSDGTVRLFNLRTSSKLQLLTPSPAKTLLPYRSFQAHLGLVRSCAWHYTFEDRVVTVGEDSSTFFWDLKDTSQPFNMENMCFMPLRVVNNVMLPGAITSSANCYSINSNRSRYLDPASLWFNKDSRKMVYATSQSACIWDISYSNWLNFVIACDSRGIVEGTSWFDLSYQEGDCKTYKHRLRIAEAQVKWKNQEDSQGTNDIQCQCKSDQSESCNMCNNQSKSVCDTKPNNVSQSESTTIRSEQLLESDKVTNQSTSSTQHLESASDQSETLTETSPENSTKLSEHNRTLRIYENKDKKAKWKHKSMLSLQSLKPNQSNQRKKASSYSEALEKNYLEFTDHLTPATKKTGPVVDQDFDVYDRVFVNSLHSIVVSPNKSTCFWVAFGGEAGLVRLVNIGALLPKKFKDYYNFKYAS